MLSRVASNARSILPNQMQKPTQRHILLVAALLLTGCQTVEPEFNGSMVPIYATRADALAITSGHFGAVPIAMAGEAEIDLVVAFPCGQTVAEVRSRAGVRGWATMESLPSKLQKSPHCETPTAGPSANWPRNGVPPSSLVSFRPLGGLPLPAG